MRKLKFNINRKYGICLCIFALIISQAGINNYLIHSEKVNLNIKKIKSDPLVKFISPYRRIIVPEIKKKESEPKLFVVTAYSLSLVDCGKSKNNPAYGISRGGIDLKDKTWSEARVVSVDPKIIPLGSRIEIEFIDEKYKIYNYSYIAGDTGIAIKGRKLDFYLGYDKTTQEVRNFGKTLAKVKIIKEN